MGIGFTLETLKALNSFDINCFVLKVSKHWVSVLSYNYVWPRGPALFATLGVPNAAGFPETCRRASSHACYSTVTPICSVADLSRSNPNKPVFQALLYQNILFTGKVDDKDCNVDHDYEDEENGVGHYEKEDD